MSQLFASDYRDSIVGKAVAFCAVLIAFYEVLGGIGRYVLLNTGTMFLSNFPNVFAALLFGVYYLDSLLRKRLSGLMICTAIVIVIYIVYAFFDPLSTAQSVFGFYVWTPFLLGMLLCIYDKELLLFKYFEMFWIITVIGVAINYYVAYPWIGMSYDVGGVRMDVAREWGAMGFDRLPGLTRASYSAATVVIISAAYILVSEQRSIITKILCYILSCGAIFLTTSKTELFTLAMLPALIVPAYLLRAVIPRIPLDYYWCVILLIVLVAMVVTLPLVLNKNLLSGLSGSYLYFSNDSMLDRVNMMWPGAFKLLAHDGNIFVGRGMGGIGMPLSLGDPDPDSVNSADNMFVYIYVSMGLLMAIPVFLSPFGNLGFFYKHNRQYFYWLAIFTFCVFGIGINANVIEDPFSCMLLGFLVARGFIKPEYIRKEPPLIVQHEYFTAGKVPFSHRFIQ